MHASSISETDVPKWLSTSSVADAYVSAMLTEPGWDYDAIWHLITPIIPLILTKIPRTLLLLLNSDSGNYVYMRALLSHRRPPKSRERRRRRKQETDRSMQASLTRDGNRVFLQVNRLITPRIVDAVYILNRKSELVRIIIRILECKK